MTTPVQPIDEVSALDALANEVDGEKALRQLANADWAKGDRESDMVRVHRTSVARVVEAARALVALADR